MIDPLIADLLEARKAKHITAAALARHIGYSPRSVRKWERGQASPNSLALKDWAQGLDFDLGDRELTVKHRITRNKAATHKEPARAVDPLIYALRKRRIAKNLAVHELADRIGYHESTLRNTETGLSGPKLALIKDWAEALGLRLELVEAE